MYALVLSGQDAPRWLDRMERDHFYPNSTFFTGFVSGIVHADDDVSQLKDRLKKDAQKELSESIRLKIEGYTQAGDQSQRVDGKEQVVSTYSASVHTSSNVEIVGIKTDAYYDSRKKEVYAFAYANKYELAGYYKANIGMLIKQAESALYTATQLEQNDEKAKARKQCEESIPILAQIRYAQDLLTTIDATDSESLQQEKSGLLLNEITQMRTRLAQNIYVYVEGKEKNFETTIQLLEPKLKAELSNHGCSFTSNHSEADWLLSIEASTRRGSEFNGIYTAYLDVIISLVECKSGKEIYKNNFTDLKGGGIDYDRAGRKAYDNSVEKISGEIIKSIEK
jgi:hypothetical protein